MRDIAMEHFGLDYDDVYTQDGKDRTTSIDGVEWQNRKILGEIGLALEAHFGPDIVHWIATRGLEEGASYSFGSVRRNAAAIKRDGGVLIAIRNPMTVVREHDFDGFEISLIDAWIENDALSRGMTKRAGLADLEAKVVEAINQIMAARNPDADSARVSPAA